MAEKTRLKCIACAATLAIPATAAGKKIRCPKCQSVISVPKRQNETPEDFAPSSTALSNVIRRIESEPEDVGNLSDPYGNDWQSDDSDAATTAEIKPPNSLPPMGTKRGSPKRKKVPNLDPTSTLPESKKSPTTKGATDYTVKSALLIWGGLGLIVVVVGLIVIAVFWERFSSHAPQKQQRAVLKALPDEMTPNELAKLVAGVWESESTEEELPDGTIRIHQDRMRFLLDPDTVKHGTLEESTLLDDGKWRHWDHSKPWTVEKWEDGQKYPKRADGYRFVVSAYWRDAKKNLDYTFSRFDGNTAVIESKLGSLSLSVKEFHKIIE
jgi:hypothetical protein